MINASLCGAYVGVIIATDVRTHRAKASYGRVCFMPWLNLTLLENVLAYAERVRTLFLRTMMALSSASLRFLVRRPVQCSHSSSSFNLLSAICRRWISSSKLTIERCVQDASRLANRPAKEDLVFGTTLSDHMLMIEWDKDQQWSDPRIVPYQDLHISPAASCLHYGALCWFD